MFRHFLDKLKQGDNKFALGVFGIVTLTGLAYLTFKNITRRTHDSRIFQSAEIKENLQQTQQSNNQPKLQPINEELTKSLLKVVNAVKNARKNNQDFGFYAVKAIYQGCYEMSSAQFQKNILQCRSIRRSSFHYLNIYHQIVTDYDNRIKEVRNRNLLAILQYFDIEMFMWHGLVYKYSSENKEIWEQTIVMADIRQLEALRKITNSPLDATTVVEIFKYKLQIYANVLKEANQIFSYFSQENHIYCFVDKRVADLIYKKFNAEEEDILYSMSGIWLEDRILIEKLQEQINNKMDLFIKTREIQ